MTAILGRKLGMSQIFDSNGKVTPVTVVEAGPCRVVQVKTMEKDGYEAVKLGLGEIKKAGKVNKPMTGFFKKHDSPPCRLLREFAMADLNVGDIVSVERFDKGDSVSVSGVTKGKGFQGVMKRLGFGGGPGSHGSMFNRAPGSAGAGAWPSKVWKNQGMPGQMGNVRATVKNLTVVDIKPDRNLLLIKGALPGPTGSYLEIRKDD